MTIGLIGKPNVGKSTFFSAATLANVDIANYPFCTIDPNIGIAYVRARQPCPCLQLRQRLEVEGRLSITDEGDERKGSICQPRTGYCVGHQRFIPVQLVDVAGLVPGAHEGKGRGNAFLSDLSHCDALIHLFDASGSTDIEGQFLGFERLFQDVLAGCQGEIAFLLNELDSWIFQLLSDGWSRGTRRVQSEGERGFSSYLHEKLSGIGATQTNVHQALLEFNQMGYDVSTPWILDEQERLILSMLLRKRIFLMCYGANKWDKLSQKDELRKDLEINFTACLSDLELALRRASESGIIRYVPGSSDFELLPEKGLSEPQIKALEQMKKLLHAHGSTGILRMLEEIVFDHLNHIVVYPVQDETHWVDGEQRILPDAFLVVEESTCKEMAFKVHTDLGEGFIRAIHGVSKRTIGADYLVRDNDVIKIHSK